MTCADFIVEVIDHVDVFPNLAQAFDTGDNIDFAGFGSFFKVLKLCDEV